MFIRPCYRRKNGKRHAYWALVESYRTERGPRQRVVGYIGLAGEKKRRPSVCVRSGEGTTEQGTLFGSPPETEWIEVDAANVRVDRARSFGAVWLGLRMLHRIGLVEFLQKHLPRGREWISWPHMVCALILARLQEPSSELRLAEHVYGATALPELLGIPTEHVDDNRLYRTLDVLLPLKEALETFLKERMGRLFALEYDLLLYDVTSTYFEGDVPANSKARRGHSRDHRPDCKQLCIALVVTRCGIPLGYEIFPGNQHDSKSVQTIVCKMEERYGQANRIWVMDRGMISKENMAFLQEGGRRYILGTPRASLKAFEAALLREDWRTVHAGVEVKIVTTPQEKNEVFILCRSAERQKKERAIHERFEKRMEAALNHVATQCRKRKCDVGKIQQRIGRLRQTHSRAAQAFTITVTADEKGHAQVQWTRNEDWATWARLSEGCYMLRSNIQDWEPEELWRAYIHLTDAEEAFRIDKQDLAIRPIWHHREDRADAHILVCFLAFVIWKLIGRTCAQAGLGDEPRRVLAEMARIQLVDVILPTRQGIELRKRCITRPTDHQEILLRHLKLHLPKSIESSAV